MRHLVDPGTTLGAAWKPREAASIHLRSFPPRSCVGLVLTPALRLTSKECSAPCQDSSVPETQWPGLSHSCDIVRGSFFGLFFPEVSSHSPSVPWLLGLCALRQIWLAAGGLSWSEAAHFLMAKKQRGGKEERERRDGWE